MGRFRQSTTHVRLTLPVVSIVLYFAAWCFAETNENLTSSNLLPAEMQVRVSGAIGDLNANWIEINRGQTRWFLPRSLLGKKKDNIRYGDLVVVSFSLEELAKFSGINKLPR